MANYIINDHDASPLSPKQIRVLDRLLAGATVTSAAAKAGVHRSTIYFWLNEDPAFKARLDHLSAHLAENSATRLQDLHRAALDAIEDALCGPDASPAVRLRAAMYFLGKAGGGPGPKPGPLDKIRHFSGFEPPPSPAPLPVPDAPQDATPTSSEPVDKCKVKDQDRGWSLRLDLLHALKQPRPVQPVQPPAPEDQPAPAASPGTAPAGPQNNARPLPIAAPPPLPAGGASPAPFPTPGQPGSPVTAVEIVDSPPAAS